jgi:hypothetical protein
MSDVISSVVANTFKSSFLPPFFILPETVGYFTVLQILFLRTVSGFRVSLLKLVLRLRKAVSVLAEGSVFVR